MCLMAKILKIQVIFKYLFKVRFPHTKGTKKLFQMSCLFSNCRLLRLVTKHIQTVLPFSIVFTIAASEKELDYYHQILNPRVSLRDGEQIKS